MGTKVIVRQDFELAAGVGTTPKLETVIIGPVCRSVLRSVAGQYDTADDTQTCYALPDQGSGVNPIVRFYEPVYGDPVFINAKFPSLTADAEQHLENIQDNIDSYLAFREGPEDRPDISSEHGKSWDSDGTFYAFHPKLIPASLVIVKKVTTTLNIATNPVYLDTSVWPTEGTGNHTVTADAVVPGSFVVKDATLGARTYVEGVDWTLEYDFDEGGEATRWKFSLPAASSLAEGDDVTIEFEAKFPFKYGDGEDADVEVDWENGAITNKTGAPIDDPIFYYGFYPVVSVAAYLQDRVTGAVRQLTGFEYTVKTVGGLANRLCVRPHLQGAILEGDSFTVGSELKYGNSACGTKSGPFMVRGPCQGIPESDTLKFCALYDGNPIVTWDFALGPGGQSPVSQTADEIKDTINANANFHKYAVAYVQGGKVCIRLRGTWQVDVDEGFDADHVDMRGAGNYLEIKPVLRDFAPQLGFGYIRICGKSQWDVTDTDVDFDYQQNTYGNVLGSVLVDTADRRYRIDQIPSGNVIRVTHVDTANAAVCGDGLTAPTPGDWGIYYADYSAQVLVTYTGTRSDLGDELIQVDNGGEDMLAKLSEDGTLTHFSLGPENPVGYALSKFFFPNSQASVLVLPVKTDDLAGYLGAIEVLELSERPHCLIPLTFNSSVHSALAAHCMDMADPETTYEPQTRFGVYPIYSENVNVVVDTTNDGASVRYSESPASRLIFDANTDPAYDAATGRAKIAVLTDGNDETVNFIDDGVQVGDRVRILTGKNKGTYRITSLRTGNGGMTSNELELTIDDERYFEFDVLHSECVDPTTPTGLVQNNRVSYTIIRSPSKAQWAATLGTANSSFRALTYSYRSVTTWGPLAVDPATPDGRSATIPGYFLNVALGAGCATQPPQQGFTNYPFTGVSRVLFTKGYFNNAQLDTLENSGLWIWQMRPGETSFHSREQFTVDGHNVANVLTSQLSIIRVADRMQRRLYEGLIGFTGVYNILKVNMGIFRIIIDAILRAAMETRYPRSGPEIIDGYCISLICSDTKPRTLDVLVRIFPPEPLDVFDITNQVRRSIDIGASVRRG